LPIALSRPRIIATARAWLGTPYLHQASAKGRGADCLGLIRGVWRELYGAEPEPPPPYTPDWNERAHLGGEEPLLDAARRNLREIPSTERQPGDVLVFRIVRGGPAKHCGILTASDRFIHAYAGRCVVESWLSRWWVERIAGVFAWPRTGNGQWAIGNETTEIVTKLE
jgi:NlpC/P60 family putative phage cell wall peptidase